MLFLPALLLLVASADAAYVRPEPRFPAPSGSPACGYQCPAIAGFTFVENTLATTTRCDYTKASVTSAIICRYNNGGNIRNDLSTFSACPSSISGGACVVSFTATVSGTSGTGTLTSNTAGSSPPGRICAYDYTTNAESGSCTYTNSNGALTGPGSGPGQTCPAAAPLVCGPNKKRRAETSLQKIIRERQYKFPKPARP